VRAKRETGKGFALGVPLIYLRFTAFGFWLLAFGLRLEA
jgi:hypothetical protein